MIFLISPLKINKKSDVREHFAKLFDHIFASNWDACEGDIYGLEDSLTQHLLTRHISVDRIRETCITFRYYLNENLPAEDKRRILLELAERLMRFASFDRAKLGESPTELLKAFYKELQDDWSEFWREAKPGNVDSLVEDLDMLGNLEYLFRDEGKDVYKQYRRILTMRGACYTQFPLMNLRGEGIRLNEDQRRRLYGAFSALFKEIEKLMAPAGFEYREEEEEEAGLRGKRAVGL